jgi:hypothetical protein
MADISKAKNFLGISSDYSFKEGFEKTIKNGIKSLLEKKMKVTFRIDDVSLYMHWEISKAYLSSLTSTI